MIDFASLHACMAIFSHKGQKEFMLLNMADLGSLFYA